MTNKCDDDEVPTPATTKRLRRHILGLEKVCAAGGNKLSYLSRFHSEFHLTILSQFILHGEIS